MGGGKRPKDLFKPVSRAYTARNKPLYHNCQLWAPDGQLLCTCDVKKALWYVEKGLGSKLYASLVLKRNIVQLNTN